MNDSIRFRRLPIDLMGADNILDRGRLRLVRGVRSLLRSVLRILIYLLVSLFLRMRR